MCWTAGVHTIHPPLEGLLPSTGIEPTLFLDPASKVAGLQVHGTTPIFVEYAVGIFLAIFQVFKLVIFLNISEEAGVFFRCFAA